MKKTTINDYKVVVGWSESDACFIARVPAFRGLAADGETPEAAVAEARIALGAMLDVLAEHDEAAPSPDNALEQVRAMLPLINISKLSHLAKINRQTLASKLKRGTRFTPAESKRIRKAIENVLA
jgi:predicted RNase H-like HicB family nuclease